MVRGAPGAQARRLPHTHLHSAQPRPSRGPPGWEAGRAVSLIRPGPRWPRNRAAAAHATRTMRVTCGPSPVLCGLLLLLQAPHTLGLAPLSRGEGVLGRWGDPGH